MLIKSKTGIFSIPFQLILYPRLSQRLGSLRVWRIFYPAYPLLYYAYPFAALVSSSTPPPSGKTGFAIWAVITPMQVLTALLTSTVTPSQTVLINGACPHPSALARTHSIAFFFSMVTRAGSTALAGAVLGYGTSHNFTGLVFWGCAAVAMLGTCLNSFLSEGTGHEIWLPGDE